MNLIDMIPIEAFVLLSYLKALAYVFISAGVGVYCMSGAKRSGVTDFWPVVWLILAMVHPVVVLLLYKYMSYMAAKRQVINDERERAEPTVSC